MFDKKIIYFLTVVKEGSFSAAGRKLYLSQSAISQHIALLEDELSIQLFDRQSYRPTLTRAGELYYKGCLELVKQYQQLEETLKTSFTQTLKIGFTGSYENKDILVMINQFKKNNPNILISFVEGNFETCIHNLMENKVDVSFGLDSDFKAKPGIVYQPLHTYELCIICAFNHPLALYDEIDISKLKKESFIVLSPNFGKGFYNDFMNAFKQDGFKPKIKKYVDSLDELVFNVSIGEGIAISSTDVVRDSDVKKIRLINSHHHSEYVIGYKEDLSQPFISSFIQECMDYFRTL